MPSPGHIINHDPNLKPNSNPTLTPVSGPSPGSSSSPVRSPLARSDTPVSDVLQFLTTSPPLTSAQSPALVLSLALTLALLV